MIKLVRLDYRLVHGQILAAWVNHLSAQRIILVDDAAANDEMKSAALKLAKPAGIRLNIFTVEKAITKMPKILELNENIMMVFGTTKALVDVCKATGAILSRSSLTSCPTTRSTASPSSAAVPPCPTCTPPSTSWPTTRTS